MNRKSYKVNKTFLENNPKPFFFKGVCSSPGWFMMPQAMINGLPNRSSARTILLAATVNSQNNENKESVAAAAQRAKGTYGENQNVKTTEENLRENRSRFYNQCFDKGRLKNFVLWFLLHHGEHKTVKLVEQLKTVGFDYARKAGISLGIDDLKIPPKKTELIYDSENQTKLTVNQYIRGEITGVERFQRLIDTWHRTSEILKQEVIEYFEATDLLNPVYMMAFSGARGNISQVRQLVGMRGLMADPQGQIIDFPIRSNFREGLTLTEYIISSYGARKGIVDTALRTANAGYLTRRLVDVAQHVIISNFDCGTRRGIFLIDMKEGNKTIHSLTQRAVGRILARDLYFPLVDTPTDKKTKIASRNDEITADLAFEIGKKFQKIFVRSPLTCETSKLICQLCYGWSLAQGNLVSIGEAVGVVAAQSIGEPGTQLTMRTFHTGGVFSGDISDQIRAPFDGTVEYVSAIPGTLIRTPEGKIAFLTKGEGSFFVRKSNERQKNETVVESKKYKIPFYTLLYLRNGQKVCEKEVIAQISSISRKKNATDDAELTIKSELEGQFYSKSLAFREKQVGPKPRLSKSSEEKKLNSNLVDEDLQHLGMHGAHPVSESYRQIQKTLKHFEENKGIDTFFEAWTWGYSWILSGKIYELKYSAPFFPRLGDSVNIKSTMNQTKWRFNMNTGSTELYFSNSIHLLNQNKCNFSYGPMGTNLLGAKSLSVPTELPNHLHNRLAFNSHLINANSSYGSNSMASSYGPVDEKTLMFNNDSLLVNATNKNKQFYLAKRLVNKSAFSPFGVRPPHDGRVSDLKAPPGPKPVARSGRRGEGLTAKGHKTFNPFIAQPLLVLDLNKIRFKKSGYVLQLADQTQFFTNSSAYNKNILSTIRNENLNKGKSLSQKLDKKPQNLLFYLKSLNSVENTHLFPYILQWFPSLFQTSTGGFVFFEPAPSPTVRAMSSPQVAVKTQDAVMLLSKSERSFPSENFFRLTLQDSSQVSFAFSSFGVKPPKAAVVNGEFNPYVRKYSVNLSDFTQQTVFTDTSHRNESSQGQSVNSLSAGIQSLDQGNFMADKPKKSHIFSTKSTLKKELIKQSLNNPSKDLLLNKNSTFVPTNSASGNMSTKGNFMTSSSVTLSRGTLFNTEEMVSLKKHTLFGMRWTNSYEMWANASQFIQSQKQTAFGKIAFKVDKLETFYNNSNLFHLNSSRILVIPNQFYNLSSKFSQFHSNKALNLNSRNIKNPFSMCAVGTHPLSFSFKEYSNFFNVPFFMVTNRQGLYKPLFIDSTQSFSLLKGNLSSTSTGALTTDAAGLGPEGAVFNGRNAGLTQVPASVNEDFSSLTNAYGNDCSEKFNAFIKSLSPVDFSSLGNPVSSQKTMHTTKMPLAKKQVFLNKFIDGKLDLARLQNNLEYKFAFNKLVVGNSHNTFKKTGISPFQLPALTDPSGPNQKPFMRSSSQRYSVNSMKMDGNMVDASLFAVSGVHSTGKFSGEIEAFTDPSGPNREAAVAIKKSSKKALNRTVPAQKRNESFNTSQLSFLTSFCKKNFIPQKKSFVSNYLVNEYNKLSILKNKNNFTVIMADGTNFKQTVNSFVRTLPVQNSHSSKTTHFNFSALMNQKQILVNKEKFLNRMSFISYTSQKEFKSVVSPLSGRLPFTKETKNLTRKYSENKVKSVLRNSTESNFRSSPLAPTERQESQKNQEHNSRKILSLNAKKGWVYVSNKINVDLHKQLIYPGTPLFYSKAKFTGGQVVREANSTRVAHTNSKSEGLTIGLNSMKSTDFRSSICFDVPVYLEYVLCNSFSGYTKRHSKMNFKNMSINHSSSFNVFSNHFKPNFNNFTTNVKSSKSRYFLSDFEGSSSFNTLSESSLLNSHLYGSSQVTGAKTAVKGKTSKVGNDKIVLLIQPTEEYNQYDFRNHLNKAIRSFTSTTVNNKPKALRYDKTQKTITNSIMHIVCGVREANSMRYAHTSAHIDVASQHTHSLNSPILDKVEFTDLLRKFYKLKAVQKSLTTDKPVNSMNSSLFTQLKNPYIFYKKQLLFLNTLMTGNSLFSTSEEVLLRETSFGGLTQYARSASSSPPDGRVSDLKAPEGPKPVAGSELQMSEVTNKNQMFVNQSFDSLFKWKQYRTTQLNRQKITAQPLAKFPNSDIHLLANNLLNNTVDQNRKLFADAPRVRPPSAAVKAPAAKANKFLVSRKPLNLASFVVSYTKRYGPQFSFKYTKTSFAYKTITRCESQLDASLSAKFLQILSSYPSSKSVVANVPMSLDALKGLKGLKSASSKYKTEQLGSIYSLIPRLFESPCFSFYLIANLNTNFFNTRDTKSTEENLRSKFSKSSSFGGKQKRITSSTKFLYSYTNKLNSNEPIAKTNYYSPFTGEIVYMDNALKNVFLAKARPFALGKIDGGDFTQSPVVREANSKSEEVLQSKTSKRLTGTNNTGTFGEDSKTSVKENVSPGTSCMVLTKADLISYYLPSKFSEYKEILSSHRKNTYVINDILIQFLNMTDINLTNLQPYFKNQDVNKTNLKVSQLVAGAPQRPYSNLLGDFFVYGDQISKTMAVQEAGQIIHYNNNKITLRRAQPIFISPKGILHKFDGDFIDPKTPVITLSYQRLKTGDIIQGIPKVEQFFEARTTKRGRLFRDSLPSLLKALFKRYQSKLPLDVAVRQSFYKIQQIIVDGVQRVYKSQGVTIADKHLEVIVKQMTSKVRIIDGAQTGFFPGEVVDLEFVEKINCFLIKKITYEPLVLGITKASLEVDSFLSAASFQQTTRVLSKAAISRKKDFLKGLKENVILGNLIPAGTGFLVYLEDYNKN